MKLVTVGDWERARKLVATLGPRAKKAIDQAILQEAHDLRAKVIERFNSSGPGWPALSSSTIASRLFGGFGGSKPLIRTGTMRNSVTVKKTREGVFVGIHRSSSTGAGRGSGGRFTKGMSVVNLALIHEFGASFTVRMTDRMRRFLFAMFKKTGMQRSGSSGGGGQVIHIRIPPRPFLGPVFDSVSPEQMEESVMRRVAKLLNGDVGTP